MSTLVGLYYPIISYINPCGSIPVVPVREREEAKERISESTIQRKTNSKCAKEQIGEAAENK